MGNMKRLTKKFGIMENLSEEYLENNRMTKKGKNKIIKAEDPRFKN